MANGTVDQQAARAAVMAGEAVQLADGPAVVTAFGVEGLMSMISQYGIHPDVCAANAAYMGSDATKFCSLLAKGAEAIGFKVENGRDDTGRLRIALSDIDISDFTRREDGHVEKWIPLAMKGEDWVNGGRKFDITPQLVKQGIDNFVASGKAPLPITYGHVDDSAAPARAWINDIELRDDGNPWGLVDFLPDTWAAIERGEYKYFSLEFYPVDIDRKGEEIGFRFDGGAILNKPFFNIRVDQETAGRRSASCFRLSRFGEARRSSSAPPNSADGGNARGQGAATMPDNGNGTAAGSGTPDNGSVRMEQVRIGADGVTLSRAQFDSLMASQREAESLRGQIGTMQGRVEENERQVNTLRRERTADRIRNAVSKLRGQGVIVQLGDFAIEASDQDAIAWLATAPYGITTVDGLEKLSKDTDATAHLPRIALGGEKGSGSVGDTSLPPVDLSTEAGRKEAVRRGVAQLRLKNTKAELETVLAKRRQTAEDFVRQELAVDHPRHAKEILAGN